jgi:hypothetical protein
MTIEQAEQRLIKSFADYAKKYGEIRTKEEGTEIIVSENDCIRFSIMGDFVSVSIGKNELPEKCATIGIDCFHITQKLRFTSHTPFEFEDEDWDL